MIMNEPALFPFTRIVGQTDMKKALLLNVIDPGIGGVLIKGEKGTAKSTAVRSLAQVLPSRAVVEGCPFGCDPDNTENCCPYCRRRLLDGQRIASTHVPTRVVELPLSATEDRVSGTLDLEHVLKSGEKRFEPGILAAANGNILYVDEINLLDDHLVDLLLDSAAMGMNYVEREGVSFSHPARFVLVGTMNPEEGDLRPQLLDRFGLSVNIDGERDPGMRANVIRRRLAFDADPKGYIDSCSEETSELRERMIEAKRLLPQVGFEDGLIDAVVSMMTRFGVNGHRADITLMKAARAHAVLEGRTDIGKDDVRSTAELVLSHRMKRRPFEKGGLDREELDLCLRSL